MINEDCFARTIQRAAPLLRLLEEDPRDWDLISHSDAVGNLAQRIAISMGLPEATAERLRLAGVLHDVGKLTVPREILNKREQLTEEEWVLIRRHPETGYQLLRRVGLNEMAVWVRCHHERPDGRGYPRRLSGGQVPIEASILAVADSYCAMTDDRAHQEAIDESEALEEIARCSGSQFDPTVAAAFLELKRPALVAGLA